METLILITGFIIFSTKRGKTFQSNISPQQSGIILYAPELSRDTTKKNFKFKWGYIALKLYIICCGMYQKYIIRNTFGEYILVMFFSKYMNVSKFTLQSQENNFCPADIDG